MNKHRILYYLYLLKANYLYFICKSMTGTRVRIDNLLITNNYNNGWFKRYRNRLFNYFINLTLDFLERLCNNKNNKDITYQEWLSKYYNNK